jgi:hypothetical protein
MQRLGYYPHFEKKQEGITFGSEIVYTAGSDIPCAVHYYTEGGDTKGLATLNK